MVFEALDDCRRHYCPPDERFINCERFGNIDGTDGACWWCSEMTPLQWHMCWDESWVRSLLRTSAMKQFQSREEATVFIEDYKHKHPMGDGKKRQ